MTELALAVPEELVEAIAEIVEVRVLERLRELDASVGREPDYLNVAEAAERLRASRQRVYDLLSSGRLQRYKDGARVLVSRAELDAYLVGDRVAPTLPPALRSRLHRPIRSRGGN